MCFLFCWALPRSLLLRCLDLRRNANLAGDLRVVFGCGGFVAVLFVFGFVMICQCFWTTRVLVHFRFSLLTQS